MRGFTLIETVIYLALLTVLMIVSIGTASALGNASSRTDTAALLSDETNFILQRIRYEVALGSQVTVFNTANSEIQLLIETPNGTVGYGIAGEVLVEERDGIVIPLTHSRIMASTFVCSDTPDNGGVNCVIDLRARDARGFLQAATSTQTFYKLPIYE